MSNTTLKLLLNKIDNIYFSLYIFQYYLQVFIHRLCAEACIDMLYR